MLGKSLPFRLDNITRNRKGIIHFCTTNILLAARLPEALLVSARVNVLFDMEKDGMSERSQVRS